LNEMIAHWKNIESPSHLSYLNWSRMSFHYASFVLNPTGFRFLKKCQFAENITKRGSTTLGFWLPSPFWKLF
jgi:hypothetical protein